MATPISQLNQSSPENVINAPFGSIFTRQGDKFFLISNGSRSQLSLPKKSFATQYKNEIWYPTLKEEVITFATDSETWVKKSGSGKTGWVFITNKSVFARQLPIPSLLINPSFEDGLNGWTVLFETGSDGGVFTYTGSYTGDFPYSGALNPPSGEHAVITDQGDPTTSVLYQDFFVPSVVNHATISFYYAIINAADHWAVGPNLDFDGPENQYATIDIMSPSADPFGLGDVLVNLYTTQETDPLFSDYQRVTVDITSHLQNCLGQTMRFRAAQVDNMAPLHFGLDEVSLIIT